jgi:hypothetical protein
MFSTISLNHETPIGDTSKRYKSQYEFGRKEWQQDYTTITKQHYTPKHVNI